MSKRICNNNKRKSLINDLDGFRFSDDSLLNDSWGHDKMCVCTSVMPRHLNDGEKTLIFPSHFHESDGRRM